MSQAGSNSFDTPEMHVLFNALRSMELGKAPIMMPEVSTETSAEPTSAVNITLKDLLVLLEAIGINVPLVPNTSRGHISSSDLPQGEIIGMEANVPMSSARAGVDMEHRWTGHSSSSSTNSEDMVPNEFGTSSSFSDDENFNVANIDAYDPGKTIRGFVCAQCNAYNLVRPAKESCYAVTAGLEVGVFTDWLLVKPLVVGVSKACYKRYGSTEDAQAAFDLALSRGDVKVLPGL